MLPGSTWLRALLVLVVFALCGAAAGLIWHWWWTPSSGFVVAGTWLRDTDGVRRAFATDGQYVVLGVLGGALAALTTARLVRGRELAGLAVMLVGSALAAWLTVLIGGALGPADPQSLADGLPDGSELPAALILSSWSPWLAWPAGALIGMTVLWLGTPGADRE